MAHALPNSAAAAAAVTASVEGVGEMAETGESGGMGLGSLKDRKKSAHWADADTEILISVLLRHKDSGRTADNGFKPSVWDEASGLLETTTYMGGPKTAEACKSRWQRLQRDFKTAKEFEIMPGFHWDRASKRLAASSESWKAAALHHPETQRSRKIHLPCYDQLGILCPESMRARPRLIKGRVSSASVTSMSDTASLIPNTPVRTSAGSSSTTGPGSLSMSTSGVPSTPLPRTPTSLTHSQSHPQLHIGSTTPLSRGHGHGHGHGHGSMHHITMSDQGHGLVWGQSGDHDGDAEMDTTFMLPDGTRHSFTLSQQKRVPSFDSITLATSTSGSQGGPTVHGQQGGALGLGFGHGHGRPSSPKRQRTVSSSTSTSASTSAHVSASVNVQAPSSSMSSSSISTSGPDSGSIVRHSLPPLPPQPTVPLNYYQVAFDQRHDTGIHPLGQGGGHHPFQSHAVQLPMPPTLHTPHVQSHTLPHSTHQSMQSSQSHSQAHVHSLSPVHHQHVHAQHHHTHQSPTTHAQLSPQQHQHSHTHTHNHPHAGNAPSQVDQSFLPAKLESALSSTLPSPIIYSPLFPLPSLGALPDTGGGNHAKTGTVGSEAGPSASRASGTGKSGRAGSDNGGGHGDIGASAVAPNMSLGGSQGSQSSSVGGTGGSAAAGAAGSIHAPEVFAAGLSEAQRRTEAVLRLQDREDLTDDTDVMAILQEFEVNINAVDMYLALRNDRLRQRWLAGVAARRTGHVR